MDRNGCTQHQNEDMTRCSLKPEIVQAGLLQQSTHWESEGAPFFSHTTPVILSLQRTCDRKILDGALGQCASRETIMSTAVSREPTTRFGQQNWHEWKLKNDAMVIASDAVGGTSGPAAVITENTVAVDLLKNTVSVTFGLIHHRGHHTWLGAF